MVIVLRTQAGGGTNFAAALRTGQAVMKRALPIGVIQTAEEKNSHVEKFLERWCVIWINRGDERPEHGGFLRRKPSHERLHVSSKASKVKTGYPTPRRTSIKARSSKERATLSSKGS